jgi:hypothetical protein
MIRAAVLRLWGFANSRVLEGFGYHLVRRSNGVRTWWLLKPLAILAVLLVGCDPTREEQLMQCQSFCTKAGARVEGFAPGEACRCVWLERPCLPADGGANE